MCSRLRVRAPSWSSTERKLWAGSPLVVVRRGCLGLRGGGAGAGCDGVGRFGAVFVGKGQRCPGFAEVPGQVGGEHADEHVGPYPVFGVVVDRAQLQIDRFDRAEVAFDVGQELVGRHDLAGVHPGCVDDVDPVQGRFDLFGVAGEGEAWSMVSL